VGCGDLQQGPATVSNLILNKLDTEMLIKTKKAGKIDKAYAVFALREGADNYTYLGHRDIEELYQDLQGVRTIMGRSGLEFWILPPGVTGLVDDDPF
jgi:hypothetical protein